MKMRIVAAGAAAAFAAAASVSFAAGLTERLQSDRMTVLNVDRAGNRVQCVEHRKWTSVAQGMAEPVQVGDIVRFERTGGGVARVVVLRMAADELTSPE